MKSEDDIEKNNKELKEKLNDVVFRILSQMSGLSLYYQLLVINMVQDQITHAIGTATSEISMNKALDDLEGRMKGEGK